MRDILKVKVKVNGTNIKYNKKIFNNEKEVINALIGYLKKYRDAMN